MKILFTCSLVSHMTCIWITDFGKYNESHWVPFSHKKQRVCVFSCSVMSDSLHPMVCRPPGSSIHGIFRARILEWVAIPDPGIEPMSPTSPALQVDSLLLSHRGSPKKAIHVLKTAPRYTNSHSSFIHNIEKEETS